MPENEFFNGRGPSPQSKRGLWLFGTMALAVAAAWFVYSLFRIDVGTGQLAVLIHKTGSEIQNDNEIAPGPEFKGVQREVLKEGRYFRDPYNWDWDIVDQKVIPNGRLGIRISLTGEDLPYGEFLARMEDGEANTKGIVPDVLRPGRYAINPHLYKVEEHDPITIPAGFKGVVTNLAGPFPEDPNQLLVEEGERGVQKQTRDPGTAYVNPYVTRISLVDCRSQRFNLAENKNMGFPSKDGFWVSLDAIIEFRVNPERAAEVFVIYNEDENGDQIDEEIIRKIILPNARSFCRLEGSNSLGREFIQGRTEFQENFQTAMREKCEPLGIEIIQALVTRIIPPEKIAKPVRDREIAKQQERKYQQQIVQQKQEEILATKRELVHQREALVTIEKSIVKVVTEAKREQEVALTKANEGLEVARHNRDAAADQATAVLERATAEADVIRFENEADASGWRHAVESFGGNGNQFAQYVLFQKMAAAYRRIMVNTADSPIMKVFESFTDSAESRKTPLDPPSTAVTSASNSTTSDER